MNRHRILAAITIAAAAIGTAMPAGRAVAYQPCVIENIYDWVTGVREGGRSRCPASSGVKWHHIDVRCYIPGTGTGFYTRSGGSVLFGSGKWSRAECDNGDVATRVTIINEYRDTIGTAG